MHAKFKGMTLQTLLRQHGVTTIKELIYRTGLSHQYCWSLWHGYDGVEGNEAPVAYVAWDSPGVLAPGRPVPVAKRPRTMTQQPRGRPRTRRMGGRLAMRKRHATYPDVLELWGITWVKEGTVWVGPAMTDPEEEDADA